ncbi:MAG: M20/M25/M40 family metallo-hydrolase [Acidothermus sp.]|nr:M20/M25/M40 family metallo-hydrolase [Acidothermus sp.]MCL6537984.1 M20/M25/M40 family metallo-hydrolase [Acidothermus sp.]
MTERSEPGPPATSGGLSPRAAEEVVELCAELIRIDTSNPIKPERPAAEYVAEKLAEVGIESTILESEPGRASVVARIDGADPMRPALLVHGHLDVVPAEPADWQVHPFAGEIKDGCLWGRGAIDMKDMDAMVLAVVRDWARTGRRPARDVVLAFVADEEAGGAKGARYLVDHHPELFEGCTESISEVGGFSVEIAGKRLYPIQTAQRGMAWLELTATGRAGHGSLPNPTNPVTALAETVARIGRYDWPIRLIDSVREFLAEVATTIGRPLDPEALASDTDGLGGLGSVIAAMVRNTANPTMLEGGYKINVVPQVAKARIDGRYLPGYRDEFFATIERLLDPQVTYRVVHEDIAIENPWDTPLVTAMTDALHAEDPEGRAVPYCLFGGTDDKSFSRLGIVGYGFSPLRLTPDLDFAGMFHAVDERVNLDALRFGVRVLDRFLTSC